MWNELKNQNDIDSFMSAVQHLHDSCIKEIKYFSGASVNESLAMDPVNYKRSLKILILRQYDDMPVIELCFDNLKYLKLYPVGDDHTCEILDTTFVYLNNMFYWSDDWQQNNDTDSWSGTVVCAEKASWRALDNLLGSEEIYKSI